MPFIIWKVSLKIIYVDTITLFNPQQQPQQCYLYFMLRHSFHSQQMNIEYFYFGKKRNNAYGFL